MTFNIVRVDDVRITETPNAMMTTLASPTMSNSETSLWLVTMEAGSAGPLHSMNSEQIWHVLTGSLQCEIDGSVATLEPADTIRIAGDVERRFTAVTNVTLVVCGHSSALATTQDKSVVPPWIA